MMTATTFQTLVGCEDRDVILYGYTHDRETVVIFFHGDKLVRVEENRNGEIARWIESAYVRPTFFSIKRWYANATNRIPRDYVESFIGSGLFEPYGGSNGPGMYFDDRPDDSRLINLD